MTKILVIEDEEPVRANILEILEAENFQAAGAENGQIGVELALQHQPDLIICDIMMPDLDGYEVLTTLRENPATATIPFIFLSAKVDRDDLRLGMELGADDYITKPCTCTELLSAITIRLKKHTAYLQHYAIEQERAKGLQKRVKELEQLSQNSEELLRRISQELRDPMSNINMAIQMLKVAPSEQVRDRYLKILQQECARELSILNQVNNLTDLITPENAEILGRFNFGGQKSDKNSGH